MPARLVWMGRLFVLAAALGTATERALSAPPPADVAPAQAEKPAPTPTQTAPCGATLGTGVRRVEASAQAGSPAVQLAWAPQPNPIPRDRHFSVSVQICGPQPWVLTAVDAEMPAHRHGMNYRASLRATSPGQWRAEGLMFHMSGRWRVWFDVVEAGTAQRLRLSDEVVLR